MGVIDELLARNRAYADELGRYHVDVRPARRLAVVTCMDSRLNVFGALGLEEGDAHVLRNAGGVVTEDVIRSLVMSQRVLGTCAVMLVQHTDCGIEALSADEFGAELERETGLRPTFPIESFSDVDESVRRSLRRVRESPFLPHRDDIRGFVYDVDTHRLREVSA
jgi:carbonic anhydrase